MIDPFNITKFNRSHAELEEFLLFCVFVCGKKAETSAKKLETFLGRLPYGGSPFSKIKQSLNAGELMDVLRGAKTGQYNRIFSALAYLSTKGLDLKECTVEDLESTPGVGMKSSRYFLLHSRPNQNLSALDTHVLNHMRAIGYYITSSTASSRFLYLEAEEAFLKLAESKGMTPSDLDLAIWTASKNKVPIGIALQKQAYGVNLAEKMKYAKPSMVKFYYPITAEDVEQCIRFCAAAWYDYNVLDEEDFLLDITSVGDTVHALVQSQNQAIAIAYEIQLLK